MSKATSRYFLILTILTAITLAFPAVVYVGFLILIVPGLVLYFAPSALLYSTLAYGTWRIVGPRHVILRGFLCLIPVYLVAVALPNMLNADLDARVETVKAQDIVGPLAPPAEGILALVLPYPLPADGRMYCPAFCQTLLYEKGAGEIIVASLERQSGAVVDAVGATAYRIERRATCEGLPGAADQRPASAIAGRIANGECLVGRPASLDEAAVIRVTGRMQEDGETLMRNAPRHRTGAYLAGSRTVVLARRPEGLVVVDRRTLLYANRVGTPFLPISLLAWPRTLVIVLRPAPDALNDTPLP
ncbi:hypothetical protein sos41_28370 [Alphaproteobacteria bacterium SO-S41]|nr:hypothetical protein sos41_28370 [Alphaproteobacteria bacterium SO-S41]